jgi:hypothetical protein
MNVPPEPTPAAKEITLEQAMTKFMAAQQNKRP